jgi:hypothetical protein
MSADGEWTAPPPSAQLLAAVAGARPVRTRRPGRAFAWAAGIAVMVAALPLARVPMRADWPHLPRLWWGAVALLWLAGFVVPLACAVLPRRDAVLPAGGRAALAAWTAVFGLLLVGFALTPDAPPYTLVPVGARAIDISITRCFVFGVVLALVPLVAGLVAVRKVLLVAGSAILAAIGAAAGALSGLVLHVLCPVGGGWHVGVGHAGIVVAMALLGATIGVAVDRRPSGSGRHRRR